MNHDSDYLSEFLKNVFYYSRQSSNKPEPQIQVVNISTQKKTTNELLDEYIDLITLYELFGDEGYKSKSEYILGLLKEVNHGL